MSKDRSISTLAPECDVRLQELGHAPHCAAIALVSSSTMGKVAADAEWQTARHAHPLERCISSSVLWRPKLLPSLLSEFHVGIAEWKAQFGIHLHIPPFWATIMSSNVEYRDTACGKTASATCLRRKTLLSRVGVLSLDLFNLPRARCPCHNVIFVLLYQCFLHVLIPSIVSCS